MTELEKAAEEYVKNRNYSDANEGYSPGEVEFECEAAFKAGAEWQANQSPWISVEDKMDHIRPSGIICMRDQQRTKKYGNTGASPRKGKQGF